MEKESDFPDEKKQRIKEDDTSMNEEIQEWLKETRDEIKEITRVEKTSKKDEKKPHSQRFRSSCSRIHPCRSAPIRI